MRLATFTNVLREREWLFVDSIPVHPSQHSILYIPYSVWYPVQSHIYTHSRQYSILATLTLDYLSVVCIPNIRLYKALGITTYCPSNHLPLDQYTGPLSPTIKAYCSILLILRNHHLSSE